MDTSLNGRVAVISGATHGLGEAVARHLGSLGADVVLLARRQAELDKTAARFESKGIRSLTISCDASDSTQIQQAAETILRRMGDVDILINNVGVPAPTSFQETAIEDWDHIIGVNLSSAFYLTRSLWDSLARGQGTYVINISGTAGLRGGGSPSYAATKFGLTGLTRALASAGKEHNVRATVLYPGSMDTGWRGAPIGVKLPNETMNPDEVARYIGYLVMTPAEFVINEAVLNPLADPFM